ncbi:hypothetical protein EDD86DRAFT_214038 [Gorgonomyces haynaldii]|nr:hypothetical protein EDD86DRAFT_214038 [Gorgonomyces haynaldii]
MGQCRGKAQGKPYIILSLSVLMDYLGRNITGRRDPYVACYISILNMNQERGQTMAGMRFFATVGRQLKIQHFWPSLLADLNALRQGFSTFSTAHGCQVFVHGHLFMTPYDNGQASWFANHNGSQATFPCRMCTTPDISDAYWHEKLKTCMHLRSCKRVKTQLL